MPQISGLYNGVRYRVFSTASGADAWIDALSFLGFKERILGVFMIPSSVGGNATIETSNGAISNTTPKHFTVNVSRVSSFGSYNNVKNNKLFTYPYIYLDVGDNITNAQYKIELFKNGAPSFEVYFVVAGETKCSVIPLDYRGIDGGNFALLNPSEQITFVFSSQLPCIATSFVELFGNNGIVTGLARSALRQINMPVTHESDVTGFTNKKETVRNNKTGTTTVTKEKYEQKVRTYDYEPNVVIPTLADSVAAKVGSILGGDVDADLARNGRNVYFTQYGVRADFAERIDDYFTMYGYAQNKIGVPNRHARAKWTYIKTANCRADGEVPEEYMGQIRRAFDNGITFWSTSATVGDYSGTNSTL